MRNPSPLVKSTHFPLHRRLFRKMPRLYCIVCKEHVAQEEKECYPPPFSGAAHHSHHHPSAVQSVVVHAVPGGCRSTLVVV